jgi:penicillin-binding protein 1A
MDNILLPPDQTRRQQDWRDELFMARATKRPRRRVFLGVVMVLVLVGCLGLGAGLGLLAGTLQTIPGPEALIYRPNIATVVYDRHGEVICRFMVENRTYVPLSSIPKHLQNAIIAIEDQHFWSHRGINPIRILKALWVDIRTGTKAQGGSTITQQFAKLAFLTHEKTLVRKIQDAVYAIQLERTYTKSQILEWYLNEIYLGHGTYGVEAASQYYFGKHVSDLTLAEAALIAALPRSPENYSPRRYPERARDRRNLVLSMMASEGYITAEQARAAQQEPIILADLPEQSNTAQQYVEYIRKYLTDKYGAYRLYRDGLRVYTTLDLEMQRKAERVLEEHLPRITVPDPEGRMQVSPQAAIITLEVATGYIRAMVGGRGDTDFNRAVQTTRQAGSAFKPFVYVTALKQGWNPASRIEDQPVITEEDGDTWPSNWDNVYEGPVTLRYGIARSKNAASVQLLRAVGVDSVIQTAESMGITTLVKSGARTDRVDALALGGLTNGVAPIDMAVAYGCLASGGVKAEPVTVLRVEDRYGAVLEENRPRRSIVLDEATAYLMTDMLSDVIYSPAGVGTGRSANIGRPAAGKTGTTTSNTDAWFVGYSPEYVTAVWIGNDDQSEKLEYNGRTIASGDAARIWADYMSEILEDKPRSDFYVPESVTEAVICSVTGDLATSLCPSPVQEVFRAGTEPTQECIIHNPSIVIVERSVCTESGLLATIHCPSEAVTTKRYRADTNQEVANTGDVLSDSTMPIRFCNVHGGSPEKTELPPEFTL